MSKIKLCFIVAVVATLGLSGCASYSLNARSYGHSEVMRAQRTVPATVVAVRRVNIVNAHNRMGGTIGAVAGGVIGHAFGHGTAQVVSTIAGTVAGAVGGSEAEKHISGKKPGLQITVRGPQGDHTIVQPADGTVYKRGERVLVIQGGSYGRGRTRVVPSA